MAAPTSASATSMWSSSPLPAPSLGSGRPLPATNAVAVSIRVTIPPRRRPPGTWPWPIVCDTLGVRVTAKVDYAVRAMVELVPANQSAPTKALQLSAAQDIPVRFLLNILSELKVAKLVSSKRGTEGGYWLARPAREVSVADVIRAVEGPLADVHGVPPERLEYRPPADSLRDVWLASRAALRRILEHVTLADLAAGSLPRVVADELSQPGAWERR